MQKNPNPDYKIRLFGGTKRRDYSKSSARFQTPNFIDSQRESYQKFLSHGIKEALKEFYPIVSANQKIAIHFVDDSVTFKVPQEFESEKSKKKNKSYSIRVDYKIQKENLETGTLGPQELVVLSEIPYPTKSGTFIINGIEKVVINQLVRSPGAYFGVNVRNKQADSLFNKVDIIPKFGAWVEIFHKLSEKNLSVVKIRIEKNKTLPYGIFLKALGFDEKLIFDYFGDSEQLKETMEKSAKVTNTYDAQDLVFRTVRRGDRISEEAIKNLIANLFFNERRYSLSETGRFLLNAKLSVYDRIVGTYLAKDLVTKKGEIFLKSGTYIGSTKAREIKEAFEDGILPLTKLKFAHFGSSNKVEYKRKNPGIYGDLLQYYPALGKSDEVAMVYVNRNPTDLEQGEQPILVIGNNHKWKSNNLCIADIVGITSYYFNLIKLLGEQNDPDSLANKRVILIGEQLQQQLKIGLSKIERVTQDKLSVRDYEKLTAKSVTNNKPIHNQFRSFFTTSKLVQYMDQINPLGELTNKRRLTSLGPGGLNRETAKFEVRDVHPTHYGKICPIETPEGQNIGLILNFAFYAKVDEHGFIKCPYFRVKDGVVNFSKVVYLNAIQESEFALCQSTVELDENNKIKNKEVIVRKNKRFVVVAPEKVNFMDVTSKQMTSIAASAIPFLESDDASRALMGANMQRQAVPLLRAEAPLVATGVESDIAKYSSVNLVSEVDGEVVKVCGNEIHIRETEVNQTSQLTKVYKLKKFMRSNQGTLINHHPIVKLNQKVKKGDLLTDATSFDKGELALGKNVMVALTTWNGYGFEDAIILSERLVKEDVFTSIHIEEYSVAFRSSKAGSDVLTSNIPNVSAKSKIFLDTEGIVIVGSEVGVGDILVGRVSPKGDVTPSAEDKLLDTIFNQKGKNVKDTSLKVKNGQAGTVIGVERFDRDDTNFKLEDGVDMLIKVYIAQKRKIRVGDKMAGRHGNKGVVSVVLPVEDMPYLEDGTPVDIILNPQGVPSRMNIGQILELHLGMAAKKLNTKFVTPVFEGITTSKIYEVMEEAGLSKDGKHVLYDGRTSLPLENPVAVGVMYMLKLYHMVDDKVHARSVGPYSLITQQPLGGKSQNGGQRFGEMETWVMESYGASKVLQELLTYKSDNTYGRERVYYSLCTGTPLPKPGTPESFSVLGYELRGLGLKLEELKNRSENSPSGEL